MKIEYVSISELQFADYNPRAATKKEAAELKKSLERFGFVEPVVVNSDPKWKSTKHLGARKSPWYAYRNIGTNPTAHANILKNFIIL